MGFHERKPVFRVLRTTKAQTSLHICPISTFFIRLLVGIISRLAMSETPKTDFLALQSKKEGKNQESIQSSTTPDPGYQWESDNVTIRHHKQEPRGQPFPSRWPQGIKKTDVHESITKQDRNNINDPQKKHRLETVSKNILPEGFNRFNGAPTSPISSDVNQAT